MKLLTQEIKKNLPKLYATESIPLEKKEVVCKFFNPCGSGTWYAIEGEERDGDFIFFGLVELHEKEWGYFSLSELLSIRLPFGLGIERDQHFRKTMIAKLTSGD